MKHALESYKFHIVYNTYFLIYLFYKFKLGVKASLLRLLASHRGFWVVNNQSYTSLCHVSSAGCSNYINDELYVYKDSQDQMFIANSLKEGNVRKNQDQMSEPDFGVIHYAIYYIIQYAQHTAVDQ